MRRQSLVAGVVLTAALATLVALPGAAGSQTPSHVRPLTADAFQEVRLSASEDGSPMAIGRLDAGDESAGHLDDTAPLIETGAYAPPTGKATVLLPAPVLEELSAPAPTPATKAVPAAPKPVIKTVSAPTTAYTRVMKGLASWYDNGTTAMRLPRGTRIKVCGARTCVSRIVRDWGPARYLSNRVVDLTPADFVLVSGHHLGTGLVPVTVYIY